MWLEHGQRLRSIAYYTSYVAGGKPSNVCAFPSRQLTSEAAARTL